MPSLAMPLPARRPELLLKPFGDDGNCVVKDPRSGEYFDLGAHEAFLLGQLDGTRTANEIYVGFQTRFGGRLSSEDLDEFIALVRSMDLVVPAEPHGETPAIEAPGGPPVIGSAATRASATTAAKPQQSILYWRKSIFDPNRLLTWLEPRLRFLWTPTFVVVSAACAFAALLVVVTNLREIMTDFPHVVRWETLVLGWLTIVVATTLHEFAHGLTCKHFGGEVHEMGFLLLFFVPCFYCNVSDAWLFREKSKRLWVTLAGAYCDVCLWALAFFAWRITPQDTSPNYVAWVAMGICGIQSFFNFNPLLKLDGYYLLSDAVGIPNLYRRGWDRFTAQVRRTLWGAPPPDPDRRGVFLTVFGGLAWTYAVVFLGVMICGVVYWSGQQWGPAGICAAGAVGVLALVGAFRGFAAGEVHIMLSHRRKRVAAWVIGLGVAIAALLLVPMEDRARGPFTLRSLRRAELRAPVNGFLREVHFTEGQPVPTGGIVLRLEVPDLVSRVAQKRAEIQEAEAKLAMLKSGPLVESGRSVSIVASVHARELDASRAVLDRLREEAQYLAKLAEKQTMAAPSTGLMVTPRLAEKIGRFFREGELICELEDPSSLEAEIAIPEQEVARVRVGQPVEVKARAAPFVTFDAQVSRIAPCAATPDVPRPGDAPRTSETPSRVSVYCTLSGLPAQLRPGMTGHARVACGKRPLGISFAARAHRYVRTEFWW